MADFCITAVRYNMAKTHIDYVEVHEEINRNGNISLGNLRTVARAFVADLIRLKKASFITRVKNADGTYRYGADVHTIDTEYLTTDKNSTTRDNLGSLPTF